jgi:hypothetical protein
MHVRATGWRPGGGQRVDFRALEVEPLLDAE